jgi:multidrug efflux pump subunit AcrB
LPHSEQGDSGSSSSEHNSVTDNHLRDQEERGLIAWFVNNHVAANILMMLFVVGGLISISSMRTETFPSIDPRLITVSVAYPGATPYEVADSITSRVEDVLIGIDGVKRIYAVAREGSGTINVDLEDFADADDVYNEVETAVNSISDFPPADAERAVISQVKVTPNVITLALHGDVPEATLTYWVETIEDELQTLPGIALTSLSGVRDHQISIEVSEEALRRYGLNLEDLGQNISNFSVNTPAGTVETETGDVSLRIQSRKYDGQDFEMIPIRTLRDGTVLYLSDVATVIDGFADINMVSTFNGERAAFVEVKRNDSEDTLRTASIVKQYLEDVTLPEGLTLTIQSDETINLNERISLMLRNAIIGFMLVFLVLLLFLDLKLAFWVSVAVPISFLGGLMIIYFMGYSINMISLFALIVVLGIVVDDAIVTGESIFEAQERYKGDDKAVIKGVRKVIAPVTIGVTTTMAAFAPLAFSTGTLGQIISIIPVVVIPILFVSLLEAYFILPSHLSSPSRWSHGVLASIRDFVSRQLSAFVSRIIIPVSRFLISWRYATLAAFLFLLFVTVLMVSTGKIRFVFFPSIEGDQITLNVTMPTGAGFDMTERTMFNIENEVVAVREEAVNLSASDPFKSILMTIGSRSSEAGPGAFASSGASNNIGQIKIQLVSSDLRAFSSEELGAKIMSRIDEFPGIEKLDLITSPIGSGADIEVELSHINEDVLNDAANDLKQIITEMNGTTEVADSFEEGNKEFVFELNREGLAVGLTPRDLGRQLRAAFFGSEIQRFQRDGAEVIVYIHYPKEQRESLSAIQDMRVRLPDGSETPLSSVASITEQTGFSQIESVDGRRIVSITSDVDYSLTTPTEIMGVLERQILPELQQRYTGLSYKFEGESREQQEDIASLARNMLIAIILIYVLLGGQLRSYIQPFIIMTAIPFGIVGAIWGHYLLGMDLTFISFFGMVALTGVVINDCVVLMDYLNTHKNSGASVVDSCLAAIQRRFRPILLTTLTTSLGLLPMLLETSMQAKFLIPMVVSLATGILFVIVVVLVLVPVLIVIQDDVKRLFVKIQKVLLK